MIANVKVINNHNNNNNNNNNNNDNNNKKKNVQCTFFNVIYQSANVNVIISRFPEEYSTHHSPLALVKNWMKTR